MPSILKPDNLVQTQKVVLIPDLDHPGSPTSQSEEERQEVVALPTAQEAQAIIEAARQEGMLTAQNLIARSFAEREDMLAKAQVQAQQLKVAAEQAGYEEGASRRQREIEDVILAVWRTLDELRDSQRDYLERYRRELSSLAVEVAGKALFRRIQENELVLTDLVEAALDTVKNAEWVRVQVSDQLPGLVTYLAQTLPVKEGKESLQIEGANLPVDGCVIDTSEGRVDASVSTQLENLQKLLEEALREGSAPAAELPPQL